MNIQWKSQMKIDPSSRYKEGCKAAFFSTPHPSLSLWWLRLGHRHSSRQCGLLGQNRPSQQAPQWLARPHSPVQSWLNPGSASPARQLHAQMQNDGKQQPILLTQHQIGTCLSLVFGTSQFPERQKCAGDSWPRQTAHWQQTKSEGENLKLFIRILSPRWMWHWHRLFFP